MFEMNKNDIDFLSDLKENLVRSHEKCNGEGYIYKENEKTACECMQILGYVIDLKKSNIPFDYWELDFNELQINNKYKDEVELYIKNIDNVIKKGLGILITCKTKGVGKTSLACEIGKAAIIKRYSVYYNLMQNIVSDMFVDSNEIQERINGSDLIIIDEMNKVAMREGSNLKINIENFLRTILPSNKTVILCSNSSVNDIEEKMELESLIKRHCYILEITGEDFSEKKQNKLKNLIDKSINYENKNILKNAKEHYKNQKKYFRKKADEFYEG